MEQQFSESKGIFWNFLWPLLKVSLLIRYSLASALVCNHFLSFVDYLFLLFYSEFNSNFLHYIMTIMDILLIDKNVTRFARSESLFTRLLWHYLFLLWIHWYFLKNFMNKNWKSVHCKELHSSLFSLALCCIFFYSESDGIFLQFLMTKI